jgi:hypothetical protein
VLDGGGGVAACRGSMRFDGSFSCVGSTGLPWQCVCVCVGSLQGRIHGPTLRLYRAILAAKNIPGLAVKNGSFFYHG